ncbi:MAG TPA: hypothetical protein VFI31_11460 [Pirellulales bacterium]|nr:hypothetical protein [Pirellulales bacterium]
MRAPPPAPYSYDEIDDLLLTVADELPRRPDWYPRLAGLSRTAAPEKRLPVYQAVRDDGCLPEDAGFFLLSYTIEDLALDTQRLMYRVGQEMDRMQVEDGDPPHEDDAFDDDELDEDDFDDEEEDEELDDGELDEDEQRWFQPEEEVFDDEDDSLIRPGESPDEWNDRVQKVLLKKRIFRNLGAYDEREMADLFRRHGDEYRHRHEKGRRYFFEPPDPGAAELRGAVQELYDHVRQCVGSRSPVGPLACRWSTDFGFVDLQIFPTPLELVGGPQDGAVVDPDVDFDLLCIQEVFDSLDGIGWTLDGEQREFHYVCFRGTYHGHDVWITVFAGAPSGEKPTMKSDELRKWRASRSDSAE